MNVKRQSSLLTCPLQGLEVTTRRKTRWITYCSQVLKTSLFTWIVSFVTPATDTQPLQCAMMWSSWSWNVPHVLDQPGWNVSPDLRIRVSEVSSNLTFLTAAWFALILLPVLPRGQKLTPMTLGHLHFNLLIFRTIRMLRRTAWLHTAAIFFLGYKFIVCCKN